MSQALRTRPDIANIRAAYDRSSSWSSSTAQDTARGASSRPVQPRYASAPGASLRPIIHNTTENATQYFPEQAPKASPVASIRSTTSSVQQVDTEDRTEEETTIAVDTVPTQATPATPSEFSLLFPSGREILIHHDDTTLDGNWNLRLDVLVHADKQTQYFTLFHLKMQDLKARVFSLRRYCRDSGREVCNYSRKQLSEKTATRPGFQRSLSHAVSNMKARSTSRRSLDAQLNRRHSGHSFFADDASEEVSSTTKPSTSQKILRLEFSNYAQVEVRRRGPSFSRGYEFEYWGARYIWRRGASHATPTFNLVQPGVQQRLAYIRPAKLTAQEEHEERYRGGWIMPCLLRIEDEGIIHSQKDISDVIVATGLAAIVDNAIKEHALAATTHRSSIPRVNFVGPKRFLEALLHRHDTTRSPSHHMAVGSGG